MAYRCERCGGLFDKGETIQLSPLSALGCPKCAGACYYVPEETDNSKNDRKPNNKKSCN